jgi:hypothetical protein
MIPVLGTINWIIIAQLGVSFLAVVALAWLARWLQLGGEVRIADTDHAKAIVFDEIDGFNGTDAILDRAGGSAIVKDAHNHHVLCFVKGNQFVAREVKPDMGARLNQKFLTINIGEPSFPVITLNLGDEAQYWASGLRHIPSEKSPYG